MAITGKASYNTHERVCALMDWASRKATPPEIRALANDALHRIEEGEPVKPALPQGQGSVRQDRRRPPPDAETDDSPASPARRSGTRPPRGEREGPLEAQAQPGCGTATSAASARST